MLQERRPRRQEGHSARGALEKGGPELVFQGADMTAQRGLREAHLLRGAAHVRLFGDRDEATNLRQAHGLQSTTRDQNGIGSEAPRDDMLGP